MMKKITLLLCALFTISLGYSQTLPMDFNGSIAGWTAGDGAAVSNGTGNDVLEIVGAVNDWDNAKLTFATPIDLSDDANNTLRFSFQSTTAAAGEVHQHGVSFQGGGGALEANFISTGTDVVDVELNFPAGLTSRESLVIFVDVKNHGAQTATGGALIDPANTNGGESGTPSLSGTYIIDNLSLGYDPGTCSDGVLNNQETAIDCGGPNCAPCAADVTPPTGFTAVLGNVGGTTVELLLNATDESGGDITYDVTYDGGGTAQATGSSSVEKSLVISGLTSETMYTFMVSASDAAGNPAANNAISIAATTVAIIGLPIDFNGSIAGWTAGDGAAVSNGTGNDVLEIVGAVNDWDNAKLTFATPIDLSDDANNTLRFSFQSTTAAAGEVHQHGVSFQGGGGALEANFISTGTDVVDVELNFPAGLTSRESLVIFVDVKNHGAQTATGGALIDPANTTGGESGTPGLSGTYIIDNLTLGATVLNVEDFKSLEFRAYPNPTQSSWTIKNAKSVIKTINVFDILGKNVLSLAPNASEVNVDGSTLKSGLYFAQVKTEAGINSIKLIKN